MSVSNYSELIIHVGHKVEVVSYGDENAAIECMKCSEILVDFDEADEEEEEEE